MVNKKTKRIKLADEQNGIPTNPYPRTQPPQPNSTQFLPNNNALAPNTRPALDAPVNPRTGRLYEAQTPFPAAAGAVASTPAGITVQDAPEDNTSAFQTGVKTQIKPIGNSGTQIFGGYFSEEYLHELKGRNGAKIWDEMRRSEAQIAMLMNAVINPIKAANWDIEAYDESNPDYVNHADLCKREIFERIDWNTLKNEMLTMIPFGFSLFEIVHQVNFDDAKFGTYNGLKCVSFRSQKTIENWQLEPQTGTLLGVNQYTYSDLGGNQFIPGDFLLVFTLSKEGDNYEGISALRPMLGAYRRKDLYLKLAAIGIEKYAVGTPIGTVPKGKERTKEFADFERTLQNYTSHESAYLIIPEGWTIAIQKDEFDASKIKELLLFENTEFANALVANFLALGMNGGGGAYALGSNLGEFFTTGIQSYADLACDVLNRKLVPDLVKLNYGPQAGYPKLKCTGISDKAGKELAETIKFLSDSRALDPDMPLKEWLRKMYKMPKPDPSTAVALPAIPAGAAANYPKPNDPVIDPVTGKEVPFSPNQLDGQTPPAPKGAMQFADKKYSAQFDKNKAKLKLLMQNNLESLFAGLKDVLRKKYASLQGSDKILAAKNISTPGLVAYKAVLRDQLAEFAAQSIAAARKQAPGKKNIKLSEAIKLGEGYYDALPPAIRKLVDVQASLVAETQAADIEKSTFFSFTTSASSTDDIDAILNDVDNAVEPSIEGSTGAGMSVDAAAGDALAHVTQQASLAFFFNPEVLDGIESFTFTNEDPISDICQELADTTFAPGDPDLDRYTPPLHHNCKSRLVPNLKGDSDNPDIDTGGVPVTAKALKSMTLSECKKPRCTKRYYLLK